MVHLDGGGGGRRERKLTSRLKGRELGGPSPSRGASEGGRLTFGRSPPCLRKRPRCCLFGKLLVQREREGSKGEWPLRSRSSKACCLRKELQNVEKAISQRKGFGAYRESRGACSLPCQRLVREHRRTRPARSTRSEVHLSNFHIEDFAKASKGQREGSSHGQK